MTRRDAYLQHLQDVPLFAACTKKDLKEVAKRAEDVTVKSGRVLCQEGKSGRQFFVIVDGTARVSRNGRKVTDLGPGRFFGEMSLLDSLPRNATVSALTDMEVMVLDRSSFVDLLTEVPSLSFKLAAGLARRLRESDTEALH